MRLLVPFGTRPEVVKLAPVVTALRAAGDEVCVVATGQHHDPALTDVFYDELGVAPDVVLRADGEAVTRLGSILVGAMQAVRRRAPDVVLVLGDTQTVPAYCLAARNLGVPAVHLEAGLRSFNPSSVEELNRRVATATCVLHLAPTALARRFLLAEGVAAERIAVVGNPVLDALRAIGAQRRPPSERSGVLLTAHRPGTVDDPAQLDQLVAVVTQLAADVGPVTFPVHPRTRDALHRAGAWGRLAVPGVRLTGPVPYTEMIDLVARSAVVVTDSGGLQEEASWLGVPVVVLRRTTPRWEGVHAGTAVLTGLDPARVAKAALELTTPDAQRRIAAAECPYGDGRTGERVVEVLHAPGTPALLALGEPDFVDRAPPC
jgi:UDP-N-acetylglucosamine 2-epimerase (non-hydrolysing)